MTVLSEGHVEARKQHKCLAYHWISQSCFGEQDFDRESWKAIQEFLADGGCIQAGEIHLSQKSVDGDGFSHFRANLKMHKIAREYDLYPQD